MSCPFHPYYFSMYFLADYCTRLCLTRVLLTSNFAHAQVECRWPVYLLDKRDCEKTRRMYWTIAEVFETPIF